MRGSYDPQTKVRATGHPTFVLLGPLTWLRPKGLVSLAQSPLLLSVLLIDFLSKQFVAFQSRQKSDTERSFWNMKFYKKNRIDGGYSSEQGLHCSAAGVEMPCGHSNRHISCLELRLSVAAFRTVSKVLFVCNTRNFNVAWLNKRVSRQEPCLMGQQSGASSHHKALSRPQLSALIYSIWTYMPAISPSTWPIVSPLTISV